MAQTILVTGSNGQLGSEIRDISHVYPQFKFIYTDIEDLDICNEQAVNQFFQHNAIDCLINCAAYTAVDKAEDDEENCFLINRDAVGILAKAAAKHQVKMIHISTDYVFDGKHYKPYTEDMPVSPSSVYGKSKAAGEELLLSVYPEAVIVRTSWLYSSHGNNFVKTMLRLGQERESINVIFDQVGSPTYAGDLAQAVLEIAAAEHFVPGIYHYSNEGVCSWYDFAMTIFRLADVYCEVEAIESKDYQVRTPRPHYSVLNKQKVKNTYNLRIAQWEVSLWTCLLKLDAINLDPPMLPDFLA